MAMSQWLCLGLLLVDWLTLSFVVGWIGPWHYFVMSLMLLCVHWSVWMSLSLSPFSVVWPLLSLCLLAGPYSISVSLLANTDMSVFVLADADVSLSLYWLTWTCLCLHGQTLVDVPISLNCSTLLYPSRLWLGSIQFSIQFIVDHFLFLNYI